MPSSPPASVPLVADGRSRAASWVRSLSGWFWLDVSLVLLVFVAYTVTLWVAHQSSLFFAVTGGLANTIPVIVVGAPTRRFILTRLARARLPVQVMGHVLLCVGYSVLSYWLLIVLLGAVNSPSPLRFIVQSMISSGMAWQTLENVTTYVAIAALAYTRLYADRASLLSSRLNDLAARTALDTDPAPPEAGPPARFLVRMGEDLRPLDSGSIISITGADDYAELGTTEGKRLVGMTLAEFETRLDPARFIRVHRSRIVNLDYVDRAEPAGGGRLLLHMTNGEVIATSRTGAQALRSRAI